MDKRPCFFCKTVDACLIEVCCDRYVCSLKCRDQWRSSCLCSSCTISTSTCPSGPDVLPDSLTTASLPSLCLIPPSSQFIHLQESLVSLISSHMLTNLWESFPIYKQNNRSRHRRLTNKLPAFIQQVGYVSRRFYVAAFFGVKMFFESNTLSVDAYDLPFLLPIACYFQADVPSVALSVDPSFRVEELLDYTSRITSLRINDDVTNLTYLLDSSSPLFLPRLRFVDFTTRSESHLTTCTFCEALLLSTTIVELSIDVRDLTTSDVIALVELFRSIHSFTSIKLSVSLPTFLQSSIKEEESLILFTALASNNSLKSLDLSGLVIDDSSVLVPLLNTSSIRSLVFPSCRSLDSTVIEALKYNLSLQEISFGGTRIPTAHLYEVFKNNTCFKKVKLCVFCYSPQELVRLTSEEVSTLKSFLESFTIKHLTLKQCRFTDDAITALCNLIRVNNSLISIDFSFCKLSNNILLNNSCLEFNALSFIFQHIASHQSPIIFAVSPHFLNHSIGTICYRKRISDDDLVSLLEALKSNVPIKSVVCPGLRRPSLKTCLALLEIHSLNKSVISFDCFPHCIDLDNGVVGFSPSKSIPVTVEEVSALQNLLGVFNIKELSLNNWRFSNDAITKLCDLIRLSTSLTSIDFSCCNLSPEQVFTLIGAFKSNSCLKTVNISNCGTNLNNLLEIFQLSLTEELLPNIKCSPHVIDISLGYIRYEHQVTSADLVSLLNALKSNVSIKHVDYRGWKIGCLEGIICLFEILSINKSVIDLDVSPHCLDIENGVFRFSPQTFTQISAPELSSLHCLLKSYSFKELTFEKCQISDNVISVLCDVIRTCHSLTSVGLSHCRLSSTTVLEIIEATQSNSSLIMVNLSHNDIGFNTLLAIFKQFSTHQSPLIIELLPHFIDFSRGIVRYAKKVKNTDLVSLLNALKSNVPIKRVECRGLKTLTLEGIVTLFEILSIDKSVIDLDVSPHCVDIENGAFCFFTRNFYQNISSRTCISTLCL
ncbi:hypothetical protein GEMRC1_009689 [Eukaryota sp. GEM-RC1]